MRPTVAVVVEHAWHRVPGGTATAVDATLDALVELDEVDLVGLAAAHRSTPVPPPPIEARGSFLPRGLLYEAWHRLGFPRSGSQADLIWAPAMAVPPASKPLVVTVHDVDFLEHPERLSRRGASFFPRAWKAAVERADRIVVPSTVVASKITERGVESHRVTVVPWGVDSATAAPGAIERIDAKLPEQFVLWVGTAEPRKNLGGLVEAMQSPPLAGVPLVVVGPAGWGIDRDATLAPLRERVILLGHLDRADLLAVYARATVFAFPSFDEGFGLPVLEAMAQGTAVVTSAGTATEEVAGGAAALVDPRDAAGIGSAIAELYHDPDARGAAVAAGRARVAEATWERTALGYESVFLDLVGVER